MRQDQTDFVILGLLIHMPLTGYDIKKRIDRNVKYFWNACFGQIYPAIRRLEEKKMVKGDKTPDRKVYTITDAGREALLEWLKEPAPKEYMRLGVLLKLLFGSSISYEENIKKITGFKERYQKIHDTMILFEKKLKKDLSQSPDHLYFLLTLLFGKKLYSA